MKKKIASPAYWSLPALAVWSLSPSVGTAAETQSTLASENDPLEEVIVTGSYMRRTQADLPSPVQTITFDDMRESGALSIEDVNRNLAINSGGAFQQQIFDDVLVGGASAFNLRNLGKSSTLVLVDGSRHTTASTATADGELFVDVNSLMPMIMVERVEILKDGGSALYGSDAVAGTVNFITRKKFDGATISGTLQSAGGERDEYGIEALWGHSSNDDRTHLVLALSYSDSDPLLASDRDFTFGTGVSTFGMPGTFATSSGRIPDPACGNTRFTTVAANGSCVWQYDQYFSILSEQERWQGYANLTQQLTSDAQLRISAGYAESEALQGATTNSFTRVSPVVPVTNPASQVLGLTAPAVFIGRPYGDNGAPGSYDHYTFERESMRLAAELAMEQIAGGELRVGASYSTEDALYVQPNWSVSRVQAALDGMGGVNGNLTWSPLYVEGNPQAEVIDWMRADGRLNAEASLVSIDLVYSRSDLMTLPAGDLGLALGGQYREAKLQHRWNQEVLSNDMSGLFAGEPFDGSLDTTSMFAELAIPVLQDLEVQLAARYEDSGDFSDTSPKISFLWRPREPLSLRGSYSKAFRAPSVFNTSGFQVNPVFIAGNPYPTANAFVNVAASPNSDLDPETADVYNFGFTAKLGSRTEFSVDYWRFDFSDSITKESGSDVVAAAAAGDPAALAALSFDNVGNLTRVAIDYINAASIETDGFDIAAASQWDSDFADLAITLNTTIVTSYDLQNSPNAPVIDGLGSRNFLSIGKPMPKVRSNLKLIGARGDHKLGVVAHYIDDYTDDNRNDARIGSFSTMDAFYSFRFGDDGERGGTTLQIGANNIFDKDPPFVDYFMGFDALVHDPRGRVAYLIISHDF